MVVLEPKGKLLEVLEGILDYEPALVGSMIVLERISVSRVEDTPVAVAAFGKLQMMIDRRAQIQDLVVELVDVDLEIRVLDLLVDMYRDHLDWTEVEYERVQELSLETKSLVEAVEVAEAG